MTARWIPTVSWAIAGLMLCSCGTVPESGSSSPGVGGKEADAEGMPQPIYRAAPDYPRRAAANRIQGCVVIAFDVRPDGLTDNFEVIDSEPQGIFVKEALLALRDWRYPKREEPIRVTQQITFNLESAREDERPECDSKAPPETFFVKGAATN